MRVKLAREAMESMLAEAGEAHPCECCGLLLGADGRIEQAVAAANVHETPLTHFEIDPQALIDAHRAARDGGPQVIGYYHSHPVGKAQPSATDAAMASRDGRIWAIIAGSEIRLWNDSSSGFSEVSYSLED